MSEVVLTAGESGQRLDKFISDNVAELTRTAAASLTQAGNCAVNGVKTAKNYRLKAGDEVRLAIPEVAEAEILPEDIPLDVRYEDNNLLVVNKPRGMVVHPANGNYSGTLVNALMFHCKDSLSGINGIKRPGIVHRIDKDTSGLLLVAKNDFSHLRLAEQIKAHSVAREYEAVVCGNVKRDGEVNAPIGRSASDRKKMCVVPERDRLSRKWRDAVTYYEIIANYRQYTHLRLTLETGRTHQIRVHTAYIGHPVAGDRVYGSGKPDWLNGQCLHAGKIGFIHPASGEYVEIVSELPDYFEKMLAGIRET